MPFCSALARRHLPLGPLTGFFLAFAFALAIAGGQAAVAAPPTSIALRADSVDFYYDRFLIEADGHVRVTLNDGTVVTGRAFSMDLRLNRFVVAGEVTLTAAGKSYSGAGFANFLSFDRQYFVPILTQPDRWTFLDSNYVVPLPGRQMPGDAFALPDVSSDRPFLHAHSVQISPQNFALFSNVRVYAGGLWVPTPRYFQSFSQSPNFVQNALPGAIAGVSLPFNGSAISQSAFQIRYDSTNKIYPSFQQNVAGPNQYLAFAISPLTRPNKVYNLIGLTHTRRFQFRAFFQESTYQQAFAQPLVASGYVNLQPTYAMRASFFQYNADFSYASLLTQPINQEGVGGAYYYPANHTRYYWSPQHPDDSSLSWLGFEHRINDLPLTFRLRSGIGTAHDSISPLGSFNGVPYSSTWTHFLGGTLTTSSFKLPGDTFINASFDVQRNWFVQPHYTEQQSSTVSLSRTYGTKLAIFVAYRVTNQKDIWGQNYQVTQYPPVVALSPQNNQLYPSYLAFTGKATQRTLLGSAVISPNTYFSVTLTAERNKDFPQPVPGFYGQAPYQVIGDVRARLARHITVDVQRTYYFHFGTENWSPTFQITVGP